MFQLHLFAANGSGSEWIKATGPLVCVVSSALFLGLLLVHWLITLRLFKTSWLIRAIRGCILPLGIIMCVLSWFLAPWHVILLAHSMFVLVWGTSLTPPSVLVLSASHQDVAKLIASVTEHARPYRTVHFLMPRALASDTSWAEQDVMFSLPVNLRIIDGTPWEPVVHSICLWVPLIVVDLRVITELVETELEWIFEHHLQRKTIFVIDKTVVSGIIEAHLGRLRKLQCLLVDIEQAPHVAQTLLCELRQRTS